MLSFNTKIKITECTTQQLSQFKLTHNLSPNAKVGVDKYHNVVLYKGLFYAFHPVQACRAKILNANNQIKENDNRRLVHESPRLQQTAAPTLTNANTFSPQALSVDKGSDDVTKVLSSVANLKFVSTALQENAKELVSKIDDCINNIRSGAAGEFIKNIRSSMAPFFEQETNRRYVFRKLSFSSNTVQVAILEAIKTHIENNIDSLSKSNLVVGAPALPNTGNSAQIAPQAIVANVQENRSLNNEVVLATTVSAETNTKDIPPQQATSVLETAWPSAQGLDKNEFLEKIHLGVDAYRKTFYNGINSSCIADASYLAYYAKYKEEPKALSTAISDWYTVYGDNQFDLDNHILMNNIGEDDHKVVIDEAYRLEVDVDIKSYHAKNEMKGVREQPKVISTQVAMYESDIGKSFEHVSCNAKVDEVAKIKLALDSYEDGCLVLRRMSPDAPNGHYSFYHKDWGFITGGINAYNARRSALSLEEFMRDFPRESTGQIFMWDMDKLGLLAASAPAETSELAQVVALAPAETSELARVVAPTIKKTLLPQAVAGKPFKLDLNNVLGKDSDAVKKLTEMLNTYTFETDAQLDFFVKQGGKIADIKVSELNDLSKNNIERKIEVIRNLLGDGGAYLNNFYILVH